MNKCIKYILVLTALFGSVELYAWNDRMHHTIALIAEQQLEPKAKKRIEKILDSTLKDEAVWLNTLRRKPETRYTQPWHHLHLDENMMSVTQSKKDAAVQVERCADILRNRREHNDSTVIAALKIVVHLVGDMHCPSHVFFTGGPNLSKFSFGISNDRWDNPATSKTTWRAFWNNRYSTEHPGFTAELYAYDLSIYSRKHKEEWAKGDVRDWANDMGRECRWLHERIKPDSTINSELKCRLENVNDRCIAKAGLRLGALLNEVFK